MKIKEEKMKITLAAILMMCLLVSGYFAVAAQPGSADDPLVTQSYLDAVVTPKAMQIAENVAGEQVSELTARINALSQKIDEKIMSAVAALASDETFLKRVAAISGNTSTDTANWQSVTLQAGQKVYLAAGTQVVLRSGKAICFESADKGLVNLSTVGELTDGQSLELYALYTATVQSSGFQTSERTKALISGDYSLA